MKKTSYKHEIEIIDKKQKKTKLVSDYKFDTNTYSIIYDNIYSCFGNDWYRCTECNLESNDCYIFLGCSFIFGMGLKDEETLPYYFSKLNNFRYKVINLGVCGRSTNTALNILDIFPNNLNNKHFFYSLIYDHIYRNFRVLDNDASDDFIIKNDNYVRVKSPYGILKVIFARSYIFRKVFLPIIDNFSQKYYENYMINSLEEMNRIIEKKYNSKLTIVVWSDDYGENFIKNLKQTSLDLIFLPEYFNSEEYGYKIKYDGHPTAKANKEIAEILYNHINEQDKKN